MFLLTLLLWLAALLALTATVSVYWRLTMPRWRRRVAIALSVAVAGLMAPLTVATGGWALGPTLPLLFLSAGLLGSACSWKLESVVARFADRYLGRRPDLQQRFRTSPMLRGIMKVRDWSRGWWA
jgi:hypothetical protein